MGIVLYSQKGKGLKTREKLTELGVNFKQETDIFNAPAVVCKLENEKPKMCLVNPTERELEELVRE